MTPSDTIYVLSFTYSDGYGDGSMYLSGRYEPSNGELNAISDTIATDLVDAKVFYSKQEAWNYREDASSNGWQITPISAKKLFTKKLKSK